METIKASFNCSQPSLYVTLLLLAQNARNNKAKLNTYKNKYTDEFLDEFVALVEEAQALPNEQARATEHENLRVDLVAFSRTCHKKFQMLKGYIEEAYEESKWIMNFDQAGWQYYDSSSWSSVTEMNNMAVSYVNANAAKLEEFGFMNASFITEITTASENFSQCLQDFYQAEENAREGTQNKLIKSNQAYAAGIAICKDGTIVANNEENPAMAEQFSFEALLELVTPQTASTLLLELTNGSTQMPLAGAEVSITGSNKKATSNAEGRAEITQLPAETIQGMVKADGFPDQPFTATLTGVTTRIKMTMTPILTGTPMTMGSEGSQQAEVGSTQSSVGSQQMAGMNG